MTLFLGTFQHFNCYERLLRSSLWVNSCCLGNLTKSTFSNDLLYRHIFSRSLPGACVWTKRSILANLFSVERTGICHDFWTSSVVQCHIMALRRFTCMQFDCSLEDKIVFNSIKDDKTTQLAWKLFQIFRPAVLWKINHYLLRNLKLPMNNHLKICTNYNLLGSS